MSNQSLRLLWHFTLTESGEVSFELGVLTFFFTADIFSGVGRPTAGEDKDLANCTHSSHLIVSPDTGAVAVSHADSASAAVASG